MFEVQFLTRKAAGEYLKKKFGFSSERDLAKRACLGKGPPFRNRGVRVLYEPTTLDEWAMTQISEPRRSTSDNASPRPQHDLDPTKRRRGRPRNSPKDDRTPIAEEQLSTT